MKFLPCLFALMMAAPQAFADPEPEPAETTDLIRLDGLWEIHIGGRNTGVELSIRQITTRFHTTFSKPPANNPLGIRVGDDFLWGTLDGMAGQGHVFLVDAPDEPGGPVKREQAPARFQVNPEVERIRVEVDKDDLDPAMQRFELVRIGRVESLRLYVKGPGNLQATGSVLEDQLMIVEVKHTNPTPSPVEVVLGSGANSLKLTALPPPAGSTTEPGILRTEPFLASFGDALGLEPAERKPEPAPTGREPTADDWKPLTGTWRVFYKDGVLGDISGWMRIDEFGRCELQYLDPADDSMQPLQLEKAAVDGVAAPITTDEPAGPPLPKFTLEFTGIGVRSEHVEKPAVDADHRLVLGPSQPKTVTLTCGEFMAEAGVIQRDVADRRKVTLELRGSLPGGSLVWSWRYRADRTTARDAEGFGRAGELRRMPGEEESTLGLATGVEVWMKSGPEIIAAICTDDQVAMEDRDFYGQPVAKYRLAEVTHTTRIRRGEATEEREDKLGISGNLHRHVFIVAKNLPPATERNPMPELRIGEGGGVKEYRILARGRETDPRNSKELQTAWTAYREVRGTAAPGVVGDGDDGDSVEGLWVLAIIQPRAEPGPQPFLLAGSEGRWNLMYGDMRGKFMIARELAQSTAADGDLEAERGEWEPAPDAFTPETLHLVVDLQHSREAIPHIKATLALNHEIVPYGPDSAAPAPILLTPDPNDPRTYRSPPIHLVTAGNENNPRRSEGDLVLQVKSGDTLTARVQGDSGYFIQPVSTTSKITTSPAELNALWKAAVKTAADIAGQPIEDWNHVVRGTADSVTNFIFVEFALNTATDVGGLRSMLANIASYARSHNVTVPHAKYLQGGSSVHSLDISIGDHAAMLLLRDEFIVMMNEQLADWRANQSPQRMRAIYEAQKQALASRQSPLSFIQIPLRSLPEYEEGPQSLIDRGRVHIAENKTWWLALDAASPHMAAAIRSLAGDEVGRAENPYLHQLFDAAFLTYKTRVKEDLAYYEQLQWSAFCHAYRQWGTLMQSTISQAAALADGDVQGLMKLTGVGFEAVVARVVPRMMKLETDPQTRRAAWVPDFLARAHVKSLAVIGNAIKAQQEYSELDTTAMLTIAAVATMPLGGGGFWSAMIAASVSAADFAYTIHHDVIGNEARRRELEFEVGAGAVLGTSRVQDTESKILSDLQQALAVAGSGLGIGVDTAAFVRSARALKTANLVEESGRLLRSVDFADPAALRALSKQDQALLAEMIRRSDELAAQGRFADIPEEFAEINRNRQSILSALDGSERFTDEAIALAEHRRDILAQADESPNTTWRDRDFEEAERSIESRISQNSDAIHAVERQADEIRARYPENTPINPRSRDAAKINELEEQAANLRNQNGDLAQRRDVIASYRRPHANLTQRQAEILQGEGLPPTRAEFDQLRATRENARNGRATAAGEGLKRVDLDAAGTRIDDLAKAARERVDDLARRNPAPGTPDARALDEARARVDDLAEVRRDIDDLATSLRADTRYELPAADAAYLRGERAPLSAADEARVVDAIVNADGEWSKLLKLADGTPEERLLMQKIHQWRRDQMSQALSESMREAERALGLPPGSIKPSAFGSTNLTSDFDISINPPVLTGPGRGPEIAVRRFQEKTRNLFGGRESGAVVDTNVYTDPVYTIFKGTDIQGVTTRQMDVSRQFLFQQMANAKYRSPGQWNALRERILNGVPAETRRAISDILDQAEGANTLARGRVDAALKARGIDAPTPSQTLRVNNDLYADALESIDGYKGLIDGLAKAKAGEIPATQIPLPAFLRKPEMERALAEVERLIRSGDPELAAKGREILDELNARAVLNMRNKQGEALYHAAEAYQTEATINHVVKEMQAPPKKVVTAESILTGNHTLRPPKQPLPPDDYVNSYFENGGNLMKELNAKGVLDELGRVIPGHKYNDKAATKASKYFIRQLDGASMAKLDMNAVNVPGLPEGFTFRDLVAATVDLERNRSDLAKFKDVLRRYNLTGEQYLDSVLRAQETLDTALMGRISLPGFANDLRAAESSAETAATRYFRDGGKQIYDPTRFVRPVIVNAGKEFLNPREEYQQQFGQRLDELEQAAQTGRFLTQPQQQELANLRRIAAAHAALEEAGATARLAGVPPVELERAATAATRAADPAAARNQAAARLRETAIRQAVTHQAAPATPAKFPATTVTVLGLADLPAESTAPELLEKLRTSGTHATARQLDSIDTLRSITGANHTALAKITTAAAPAWIRIHRVDGDRVIADDPTTGTPTAYPAEVFLALASAPDALITLDPYRHPDGTLRDAPATDRAIPPLDLNAALALPGGH